MKKDSIALTLVTIAAGVLILFFIFPELPQMIIQYPKFFAEMTNEGYLAGTVTDATGAPFDNFKLIVYHKDSGVLVKVVHTDVNGNYGLPLNIGDYRIVTSQGTYEVTIESGKTTTLNI